MSLDKTTNTSMYTLKVNIRAQEEREKREKERVAREAASKLQATSGSPARPRKRKGLNFYEPGTFIAKGEQLRKKAKLEALQKKIAAVAAKTGITDAVKLATLTNDNKVLDSKILTNDKPTTYDGGKKDTLEDELEEVPDIEWWDIPLVKNQSLATVVLRLDQKKDKPEDIFNGISNLVEHPPPKRLPIADKALVAATAQPPVFLTKKERKKLRRENRKNVQLERREQIKLGLIPKPEPKLKKSNLMYALANEGIVNPSTAEILVKEQVEKRQQAHLEHNESNKLTLDEKRMKKLRKVQEDLSLVGTWTSVYRILDLKSQSNKFKISQNAKQLTMTGVMILYKDINLVVVEGGPKQQRKFKHLMMDRIRWNEEPDSKSRESLDSDISATYGDSTNSDGTNNRCLLAWEGQVKERSFRGFKTKQMSSENEAKSFFQQNKVEHYWDLAYKMSILETIEEP